jgi:hypothetical protein
MRLTAPGQPPTMEGSNPLFLLGRTSSGNLEPLCEAFSRRGTGSPTA